MKPVETVHVEHSGSTASAKFAARALKLAETALAYRYFHKFLFTCDDIHEGHLTVDNDCHATAHTCRLHYFIIPKVKILYNILL